MRVLWGVGVLCWAGLAGAQTLQVGNTSPGDPGNAWEMSEYAQAQAFHTTDAFTAKSLSFWTTFAGPIDAPPTAGTSGLFDWSIYTDDAGTLGNTISSGRADQTIIGQTSDGSRVQWGFDLPSVTLDAHTEYWISIHNTDASGSYTPTNLYWTADITGYPYTDPGSQYYNPSSGQWTSNHATDNESFGYGNHLTLALYGDPLNTTTTPEPGTLALLGTGLVGIIPLVRRRVKSP